MFYGAIPLQLLNRGVSFDIHFGSRRVVIPDGASFGSVCTHNNVPGVGAPTSTLPSHIIAIRKQTPVRFFVYFPLTTGYNASLVAGINAPSSYLEEHLIKSSDCYLAPA